MAEAPRIGPPYDTILSNKAWRYTILCFFCRMPPGRLRDESMISESDLDGYCWTQHTEELHDLLGLRLWWGPIDVYPTDVFVAVRK